MEAKEFFKRFVWGEFFPALAFGLVGIFTAAFSSSRSGGAYYEFITASVLLLTGAAMLLYYIFGNTDNVCFLLSGVATVSVSLYMFVPTFFAWWVIPIALGVLLILHGGTGLYTAIGRRRELNKTEIARLVFSVLVAACGAVSCARVFATTSADWVFTGVSLIAMALCELVFLCLGGLFREEEQLKFRPVRKPKEEAPQEAEGEGENEAPAVREERRRAARRSGKRR